MPATNPRLSLTLDPAFDVVLTRLSRLTGRPKSAFLMEVIRPALPFFEEAANLMEQAQEVQAAPSRQITEMRDLLVEKATSLEGLPHRAESLLRELAHVLSDDEEGSKTPVQ